MSRNTWWVEYTYTYEYWDSEENEWLEYDDCDADRFHCLKKDIKKEVEKRILEDLSGDKFRNLKINIYDKYITTDCEV